MSDITVAEIKNEGIREFIKEFEASHFRTIHDTGATFQTMFLWNMVRNKAGLPRLEWTDLAAYCVDCRKYHVNPHTRIQSKYDNEYMVELFKFKGIY